ncbi:MAG TPA: AMP-binding protein [Terriglobales bacterium]|jgi:long-chain acyl-CoA synthetase|nr:AMP-binding protein [Terriglobales bacterium]
MRTLYADPHNIFLHDAILQACSRFGEKLALIDTSRSPHRRFTYGEYGETVERLARGLVAAGLKPGEVLAIYLPNCWEFCAAYHAATLAGGIVTLLNPSYREREVRYQLENSGAAMLISDSRIGNMSLSRLPALRRVYTTGDGNFSELLRPASAPLLSPGQPSDQAIAALPYSSGTTGLPKGVMLSHFNLLANIYQIIGPDGSAFRHEDVVLCFLPLYHIYGLNVVLTPPMVLGATIVLMPRFDTAATLRLITSQSITCMPCVPPILNAFCQAVEQGAFPRQHQVGWVKSGAAPLAPELAYRFTELTGIKVVQGYGMTEASPVTHLGYLDAARYRPDTIGQPAAQTECRILDENDSEVATGERGELVMRGPQFMLGYWKEPAATASVLRDGWYWSGDVATRDAADFFRIVDRRKEMIKYKGFPVAPAEVEAVLLEHPAVRDCGVVGKRDAAAGELPCAFVVLREGHVAGSKTAAELCDFVAQRLTGYKQPREIRFVESIPRTPSGKVLRRELRQQV